MYGFVNSALEKLILRRFGREKWEEIRQRADNIYLGEKASFLINTVYKDEDTYLLVGAACEVLGLDAGTILEMFGEQFLIWCKESGYAKTLELLGRSLQDFLTNLDALHDHLSIIYPQMDAPSFRCTEGESKTEFHLHYYSNRDGLESIVKGIVKAVGRAFYGVEVAMTMMQKKGENGHDHSLFHIKEVAYYQEKRVTTQRHKADSASTKPLITPKVFCKAFPFHIIFDRNLQMFQVGVSLDWIIPNWRQSKLTDFFMLERPRMRLQFNSILSHINTIFILKMLASTPVSSLSSSNLVLGAGNAVSDVMRLRGQMIYLNDSDSMLFLCSPRVSSINDLEQRGLYLSDIPLHDATRSLVMMSQTARSEFHHVIQLEEVIGKLHDAQQSLEEEKGRMNDLLHEMLPISVADSLMAGQMIEAERFESVTILFSDIVGFTSICGHCKPIQIVDMLNKLYTMFDMVVGRNRVYKVETIGDAYMVVGGLPERNTVHAECVANQGLDMMYYCTQVIRPDTNEAIRMRIGIHSGEVVAGVVGRRMPRYCLFGNTVNIASRTESNGEPGKIQVTEETYKLLQDNINFTFSVRGPMQFKNVAKPMMCYFLEENAEKEFYPIDVPEEMIYNFIAPTGGGSSSPPPTPYVNNPSISFTPSSEAPHPLGSSKLLFTPELNVITATPECSPPTSPTLPHLGIPLAASLNDSSRKTSVESSAASESELSVISNDDYCVSPENPSPTSNLAPLSELPVIKENGLADTLDRDLSPPKKLSPERDERDRRSLSVNSEEGSGEDDGHMGSGPTSPVRYVRPRTSSIKDRIDFFKDSQRNRRSGLSTTSYLQNSVDDRNT